ncbi:MAG: ThiF family adenylyltransferase [Candidatus Omnitrophica bacterium]|nr:ThiF family adenylyltransferase [Candidatus Omnitrophota bacterium]MBU4478413.1 ThiF family adenylyltransferase [Candidatus Omnitrophota bacterium]
MELWFLSNPEILRREREAFNALQANKSWLSGLDWAIEDQQLCVYVVINVANTEYKAKLVYSKHFPDAPPIVLPQLPARRWSTHQYGENGSLCLEWGPDNWVSSVTGAEMVVSMYNLLASENPVDVQQNNNERIIAPSRHSLEIGQEIRGRYCRYVATKTLLEHISKSGASSNKAMKYSLNWLPGSLVAMIHEIGCKEHNDLWTDMLVPSNLNGRDDAKDLHDGLFLLHSSFTDASLKSVDAFDKLMDVIASAGFDRNNIAAELKGFIEQKKVLGICLLNCDKTINFYISFDANKIYRLCSIYDDISEISMHDNALILSKKVCIIGLGSVGSKIADTLARIGVKKFHLVDYDIFLPHNIERHVLHWEDVGEHKTKVVKRMLEKIVKNAEISISEINLTGQESNLNLDTCLMKIAQCDLIIDATANDRVFNLMSSVVKREKKPFLWMGVFEGGKGGLIARYLPDKDPFPEVIRAAFNQFCIENPFPESKKAMYYASEDQQGKIMVASDADVSVIAYNAARICIDCLLESYEYKYQTYLIGLGCWWVFKCPLDIIPIDCSSWKQVKSSVDAASGFTGEDKKFLEDLVQKKEKK